MMRRMWRFGEAIIFITLRTGETDKAFELVFNI